MGDRERTLWLWTGVAVAGVFASLGLSSLLTDAIHSQQAAAAGFLAAMFLIGVMVVTQGLYYRPRGVEVGIVLGIAAVYLMVLLRLTLPERSHLIEFGVVAVLLFEALSERERSHRTLRFAWLWAIVGTALIGVADELLQLIVPHRVFDPADMLFNLLAATAAVLAVVLIRAVRRGRLARSHGAH